jgi:diphthine synthase
MLYLVGLGIWDEKDMSIKGIEICKNADKIYAELYTATWGGSIKNLEKIIGKKITLLQRKDIEEDSENFIKEAKKCDIVLLVPGDPLVATTHTHLIIEAKKRKTPFDIVHSSSIYTAIAKTGLQIYKFGRTVTIPTPQKGYEPTSFYDLILENKKSGLHTLVLLDRDMNTKRGLEILMDVEKRRKKKVFLPNTKIVLCSKLGSKDEKIIYGCVRKLLEIDLKPPAVVIIPGNLHFIEEEFLSSFEIR